MLLLLSSGPTGVYTLPLGTGAFTLTGGSLTLGTISTMALGTGSFTLTGRSIDFSVSISGMFLDPGEYVVGGQEMTFSATTSSRWTEINPSSASWTRIR